MPAANLFTGATQPTTEDPYATGAPTDAIPLSPIAAPANAAPVPVASDPYASATPLGISASPASQPAAITPPVSTSAAPPAQRPWWEQARTNLGNLISPGPHAPAPEPRDPSVKPETPTPEQAGFTPTTAADWEMQLPDGSWEPYPYEIRPNMAQGGYIGEPSLNPNTWEWSEADVLPYRPGEEFKMVPRTTSANGNTTYLPEVTVRRRGGPTGATQPTTTSGAGATPAATTSPDASTNSAPVTTSTTTSDQQVTWDGYLTNPAPAGTTSSTTQPATTGSAAPAATSPAPVQQSNWTAPATNTNFGLGAPQQASYRQDIGNAPARASGGYDGYFYGRQDAGAARSERDIFDDPIFARYFQVLSQQHGSDRARQMIREMARRGNSPRGARAVNLVPGQDGFLENLNRR